MGLALRDTTHHTYGDYLTWSEDVRYELIDGVAYLMSPAPTPRHQNIAGEIFRQLANALEAHPSQVLIAPVDVVLPKADEADVREYWLIHPIDRVLTVYRLEDREFGKPDVQELKGETAVGVLSGVTIQWDALVARLPAIDD